MLKRSVVLQKNCMTCTRGRRSAKKVMKMARRLVIPARRRYIQGRFAVPPKLIEKREFPALTARRFPKIRRK